MNKTRTLIFVSLLIAMEVIFTRFLAFQTPIIRIGFGFIPIAFAGILFGPVTGGIAAALSDVIGMLLFPKGAYFPGFTLSAFITGAIYGFFLHKKPVNFMNLTIAVLLITVIVDLGLNTLWISMITGKAVSVLMMPRVIKSAIMLPVQIVIIQVLWRYIGHYIKQNSIQNA